MFLFKKFVVLAMLFLMFSSANATVLPNANTQNEIKWQLLELAIANFDKRFAVQFDKIAASSKAKNLEKYAKAIEEGYFLVKSFREFYRTLPWDMKQNFNFKMPVVNINYNDIKLYEHRALNGSLFNDVESLRPKVAFYNDYRYFIREFLKTKDLNLPRYNYKVHHPGEVGEDIRTLKKVLKMLGYLSTSAKDNGTFDQKLFNAVVKFQKDNSLKPDGIVGYKTYRAMYLSNTEKAVALARTILRLDDESLTLQNQTYVIVNLPEEMLHVYSNGASIIDSKVIIGKSKAKTPLLSSKINNVVFNPYWNVPKSIKKDYINSLRSDPLYLQKRGIDIVDSHLNVIDPLTINRNELDYKKFRYLIRQKPGVDNALGLYKFNFPNSYDVYLHSTSNPKLFSKEDRALSSGCVRVEKSRELAEFLLQGTSFSPKVIQKLIDKGETKWAPLENRIPIFIAYWTAYIGYNKKIYFHDDIYSIDSKAKFLPYEIKKYF